MKSTKRVVAFATAAITVVIFVFASYRTANAQVPPHAPGTICFTPQFWCWAQQPGPVGGFCGCYTSWGFVPGALG